MVSIVILAETGYHPKNFLRTPLDNYLYRIYYRDINRMRNQKMTTATTNNIEIREYNGEEMLGFTLWWDDFEEAGIESVYVAYIDEKIVGFQAINTDGLCGAIEVLTEYQGMGVARNLIEESGCFQPAENYNPEFWAHFADDEDEYAE